MKSIEKNLAFAVIDGDGSLDGDTVTPTKGTLLNGQPALDYEVTAAGDLIPTQEDATILIRRDVVMPFLDRLASACGWGGSSAKRRDALTPYGWQCPRSGY